MFFAIDGIDGTGKTTQAERLASWLRGRGYDVVTCRDPGSTPAGETIRRLLLDQRDTPLSRRTEMLLYMAARSQLVDEVIAPALAEGKVVVSDRYLLANVVYQGYALGLDVETLWQVGQVATRGVMPDLTVVLDLPPPAALARLTRELDRIEDRGEEYRHLLREGFLTEAARRPKEIVVIDASRGVDEVAAEVRAAVEPLLSDRPS